MGIELQKELKSSKSSERKYYIQEIKKLREEQDKLKEKLNNLFDLRLDGEKSKPWRNLVGIERTRGSNPVKRTKKKPCKNKA